MGDCACDVSFSRLDQSASLRSVYLELTPACNNACPGCSNVFAHSDAPAALATREWVRVLERLAPYHPRLRFTGGEPTLHPEFEQIIGQAQKMGFTFSVFTNARWREPTRTTRLFSRLSGLECLLVSLHGAHAGSHEAFTAVPCAFQETITNIREAVKVGVRVNTSTVITCQNHAEVPEIIALSQALGAGQAVFNRYIGAVRPGLEADLRQLEIAIAAVEHAGHDGSSGRVKFGTPIPHCFATNGSNGCMAGFVHVTVDPWGNVRPCPHVSLIAGNLLVEPLDILIESPEMQTWRRRYLAPCEGCGQQRSCFAVCQAMAYLHASRCDPLIC